MDTAKNNNNQKKYILILILIKDSIKTNEDHNTASEIAVERTTKPDSIHALTVPSYTCIHTLHSSRNSFPRESKLPSAQAELEPTAVPGHQNVFKDQDEVFRCL